MLKRYIECDYLDCGRIEEIEYEDQVPKNWHSDYPDYWCPRHYNPYVAWTPRVKSQLEATIETLYAPYVEQQLKNIAAFAKLVTPKEKK
jgi:hypothetical protein